MWWGRGELDTEIKKVSFRLSWKKKGTGYGTYRNDQAYGEKEGRTDRRDEEREGRALERKKQNPEMSLQLARRPS